MDVIWERERETGISKECCILFIFFLCVLLFESFFSLISPADWFLLYLPEGKKKPFLHNGIPVIALLFYFFVNWILKEKRKKQLSFSFVCAPRFAVECFPLIVKAPNYPARGQNRLYTKWDICFFFFSFRMWSTFLKTIK